MLSAAESYIREQCRLANILNGMGRAIVTESKKRSEGIIPTADEIHDGRKEC